MIQPPIHLYIHPSFHPSTNIYQGLSVFNCNKFLLDRLKFRKKKSKIRFWPELNIFWWLYFIITINIYSWSQSAKRCYYNLQPGTKCLKWILKADDQESYLWRLTGWVLAVDCVRSVSSRCRSLRPLCPLSVSVDCTRVCLPCSIRWIREDPLTTYHSLRILYWNGLTTPLSRSRPTGSTWKPRKHTIKLYRILHGRPTPIRFHFL